MSNILSSRLTAGDRAVARSARRIPWRRMFLVAAYMSAIVLAPAIVGTVNLTTKLLPAGAVEPVQSPAYSGVLPAPPALDPAKKIAVVVSGPRGVEIGDAMEAYEVLARSDVYNVYTVAPQRKPLSLNPGPTLGGSSIDFIPHFSFAEYEAQIGRAPDLIAIPYFDPAYSPEGDAATLDWIRSHFGSNTTILGICSGNIILADTGLVAGRNATTNTGTFDRVQAASPTTNWLHNLRYVDDGNIVTASNLTSGIAGALHVVDREAGRAKALDVARQIGYTHTEVLSEPRFDPADEGLTLRLADAALSGPTEKLGVVMYDGMTELGLAWRAPSIQSLARSQRGRTAWRPSTGSSGRATDSTCCPAIASSPCPRWIAWFWPLVKTTLPSTRLRQRGRRSHQDAQPLTSIGPSATASQPTTSVSVISPRRGTVSWLSTWRTSCSTLRTSRRRCPALPGRFVRRWQLSAPCWWEQRWSSARLTSGCPAAGGCR
jgi:putative intracellular protease/amidase